MKAGGLLSDLCALWWVCVTVLAGKRSARSTTSRKESVRAYAPLPAQPSCPPHPPGLFAAPTLSNKLSDERHIHSADVKPLVSPKQPHVMSRSRALTVLLLGCLSLIRCQEITSIREFSQLQVRGCHLPPPPTSCLLPLHPAQRSWHSPHAAESQLLLVRSIVLRDNAPAAVPPLPRWATG